MPATRVQWYDRNQRNAQNKRIEKDRDIPRHTKANTETILAKKKKNNNNKVQIFLDYGGIILLISQ